MIARLALHLRRDLEEIRQIPADDFFRLAQDAFEERADRLRWEAGLAGVKLNV